MAIIYSVKWRFAVRLNVRFSFGRLAYSLHEFPLTDYQNFRFLNLVIVVSSPQPYCIFAPDQFVSTTQKGFPDVSAYPPKARKPLKWRYFRLFPLTFSSVDLPSRRGLRRLIRYHNRPSSFAGTYPSGFSALFHDFLRLAVYGNMSVRSSLNMFLPSLCKIQFLPLDA